MSNISAKITKSYRYFFYSMLSVSLITGSGFWLLQNYAMQDGEFGPESHFLQYPALQLHGFSAFLMMMSLGAIFASHIPKNWHYGRGKKSGSAICTLTVFSLLSAYSLYYLVGEDWHTLLANSHAIVGLSLPVILFLHIKYAKKSKVKKTRNSRHKSAHYKKNISPKKPQKIHNKIKHTSILEIAENDSVKSTKIEGNNVRNINKVTSNETT